MPRRARYLTFVVAALLAGCGTGARSGSADRLTTVSVSVSQCGQGWQGGSAGLVQLTVRNTDSRAGDVDLIDPRSGAVYAEIEPLGPGTTETMSARLGKGTYALRCSMEDEASVTGPSVTLTGSAKGGTPGVVAVSEGDLIPATKAYEAYVTTKLPGLGRLVATLHTDVAGGDLAAARRDWLPAQLAYLQLGAAYGAFGADDAKIDGLAEGLARGVDDPSWTGLHRLEYGLWHGQSAATLAPITAGLIADVHDLTTTFPTAQIDPLDIGIRAHEITEGAVDFSLTGRDDYGAHADLAFIYADLGATRTVLGIVRTLLAPRYPGLEQVDAQLTRTAADLAADRHGSTLPPLAELDHSWRIRINSDESGLAELLAPVASILEPRRTS